MRVKNKEIIIGCYIAFAKFSVDNNIEVLVATLERYNKVLTKGRTTNKSIWFRFYSDDTLVTTIFNIERSFVQNDCNVKHYISDIELCLTNQSLEIYFS